MTKFLNLRAFFGLWFFFFFWKSIIEFITILRTPTTDSVISRDKKNKHLHKHITICWRNRFQEKNDDHRTFNKAKYFSRNYFACMSFNWPLMILLIPRKMSALRHWDPQRNAPHVQSRRHKKPIRPWPCIEYYNNSMLFSLLHNDRHFIRGTNSLTFSSYTWKVLNFPQPIQGLWPKNWNGPI